MGIMLRRNRRTVNRYVHGVSIEERDRRRKWDTMTKRM